MVFQGKVLPKKIHIIGSVGSGKTSLARKLSSQLGIPYYELDNVVRKRQPDGDVMRTPDERDKLLHLIISKDQWIIEGVHSEWVTPSFMNADIILFLDPSMKVRRYRILRRFILQKLGLEKAHYKPTWKIFKKMFEWNNAFEVESKPNILQVLRSYKDKVIVLTNSDNFKV